MLIKTRGVVLKFIKYRETSIIVNIYTEILGLQTYIINGIRSPRSKRNRIALYQPLTMLDLVVYYREEKQINRLAEAKCHHLFYTILLDPKKTSIALFLVEILSKTLKEQTGNKELFDFIWDSILQFDTSKLAVESFHLVFIIKLTRYLGFNPQSSMEIFEELKNDKSEHQVKPPQGNWLDQFLKCDYSSTPPLTHEQRSDLLNIMLSFYRLHVEQFGTVKSVKVLKQVFK